MPIDYSKYPFDIRIRHHVSPNLYFPYSQQKIQDDSSYPPLIESLEWKELFENSSPANVLDIGCGMGKFLLDYSVENPNDNILGIEVRKNPVNWIKSVIEGEKLGNVNVIWYSVVNRIDFIESNTIDKIFYFFPDPWFKEKHKKRRAFKHEFIEDCIRILKKDAVLYLQTDIEDVHHYQSGILKDFEEKNLIQIFEPNEWSFPVTDKEEHCIRKNFQYWRLCARKL